MRPKQIIVTGGAGFIGRNLVRSLVADGHEVIVIDNYDPQVHSKKETFCVGAKHIQSDMFDLQNYAETLKNCQVVFHLAGAVGSGQSLYNMEYYCRNNVAAFASLLDAVLANKAKNLEKLIIASSVVVYSDRNGFHEISRTPLREDTILDGKYDVDCIPQTVYGLTKKSQEELAFIFSEAYKVPVVNLRLFNTYGVGQCLSNPYSGIVPLFISQIKDGVSPVMYACGRPVRDFVYVDDVVRAFRLAMSSDMQGDFNVGTGIPTSMLELGTKIRTIMGSDVEFVMEEKLRLGDMMYQVADISKIGDRGFVPEVSLGDGLKMTIEWALKEGSVGSLKAHDEMSERDLLV